jgi:hypothetical protein
MSRFKALGAVVGLVIGGGVATAQNAVTNLFDGPNKVVPDRQLTGSWSPDDRYADAVSVLDADAPAILLGSSNVTDPNGAGTLFLADLDFGQPGTPAQWRQVVSAIPEPSPWTLLSLGGLAAGAHLFRRRRSRQKPA